MTTRNMQIQRYLLLLVSAAGLVLLAYLLSSGWLQALVGTLTPDAGSRMIRDMLERTPGLRGFITLAWFHYLLWFTLAACFVQIVASLLKPVRNAVLLTINWGILLSAAAAMLYYWAFDPGPRTTGLEAWLTIQASVLCCALAMHVFARAFLAYPVPMTDERVALYHRRYLQRPSQELTANKHTPAGRRRRALLAWEMKLARSVSPLRKLGRSLRREKRNDLSPRRTRFLLLYGFPGTALIALSALWSVRLAFGEDVNWAGAFVVVPVLGMIYAWSVTMGKILMDYRLGDATVRKQVLWLLLGTTFPVWALGVFCLGLAVAIVAPGVLPYIMLFLFPYTPLLAFLLFVLCLMISIFFYGAIDPERVLRASALYSFLSLLLTVLFAAVEQVLSPLVTGAIGLDGTEGAIASAALVALSFKPLRGFIDTVVERAFQKLLYVAPTDVAPDEASSTGGTAKSSASASPG